MQLKLSTKKCILDEFIEIEDLKTKNQYSLLDDFHIQQTSLYRDPCALYSYYEYPMVDLLLRGRLTKIYHNIRNAGYRKPQYETIIPPRLPIIKMFIG